MHDLKFAERVCSKCQRYPCNYTRECVEVDLKTMEIKFWFFLERKTEQTEREGER